jgi:hypothetical protein
MTALFCAAHNGYGLHPTAPLDDKSRQQGHWMEGRMQRKKAISLITGQAQLKALADVLDGLHRPLLDYGPPWYTSEIDDRLRKAQAEAESVLSSARDANTKPPSSPKAAA